ncbi:hypothetical protein FEM48_Zijuj04G0183600 [Ziziphus jujuba var. spinosa]|uniref:Uncharacterized protein n=1 Tax=Ziziphus jujuba var. spinosa TaxID=714518 RepID=A0A978VLF9_ZIZJJ|nr:hypothetical protein FEM48_Zijuj04G0183600 [Ziziphus jujuba var. spinosa]
MLKNCYEFSTLCRIDVCMIIYVPKQIRLPTKLITYPDDSTLFVCMIKQFQTTSITFDNYWPKQRMLLMHGWQHLGYFTVNIHNLFWYLKLKKDTGKESKEKALLELATSETQLENEADQISSEIEQAKKKLKDIFVDLERELEFDIGNFQKQEDLEAELEVAKKELASVKEENFLYLHGYHQKRAETCHGRVEKTATKELEAVKSSVDLAVKNLRSLIEDTMKGRSLVTQQGSFITISKFEYEYLTGRAVGAEEIADKKVAASQA